MFNELSSAIPDVKKSEQDPVLKENANVPNGMLSIRIFGVSNIHLSKEIAAESFGLYVNITVGAMSKSTSVQPYGKKRKVIWDEVRNFSILVPNKISNCLNRVKIAVIGFDQEMPRPKYRLMGKIELHLHKIIKKQWTMETFEMQNKETKHSGDISVEFAFAYGNFGYGFSDQLESSRSKALVEQSAFPKLDPLGTTFNKLSVLAIPRKVPHPKYIPFVTKVINLEPEMSPTYALRTINQDVFKKRPVLDQKLTRLKQLCTEYSIQSSRTKRVAFLKKLIADKESLHTLDEVEEGEDKQDEFSSNGSGGGTIGESGLMRRDRATPNIVSSTSTIYETGDEDEESDDPDMQAGSADVSKTVTAQERTSEANPSGINPGAGNFQAELDENDNKPGLRGRHQGLIARIVVNLAQADGKLEP